MENHELIGRSQSLPEPHSSDRVFNTEKLPIYKRPRSSSLIVGIELAKFIKRHETELVIDDRQLPPDVIDSALLELFGLANELVTSAKNSAALVSQKARIDRNERFLDKTGDDSVAAFMQLRKERRIKTWKETQNTDEAVDPESNIVNVKTEIEQAMVRLLTYRQIKEAAEQVMTQEWQAREGAKSAIFEIMDLENALDEAKAEYRQIQNEPKNLGPGSIPLPTAIVERNLRQYKEIIEGIKQQIHAQEARLDRKALGLLVSARLLKTKRQMKEFGFAMTESRQALFDRISELASAGYKIFLGGPTGTGKTSLAVFAMRQIVGSENQFEVVSWSPDTTTRDLFGKPIIKANEQGQIESTMQKGPYARVLSGETRGVINDEYTAGQTATQISLKRVYQTRPGETLNLPGFNGQIFTKEDYVEISTGNLRSRQHQQREEMDPAIAREFVAISVPFMNSEEAKRVLLSSFIHEMGFLPISKADVEMIDQLCKAAEFTQKAFQAKFTAEERQSDIYRQIEPSGAEIHLTKTFLDSGTLFRLLSGASGRSFAEHLQTNLDREINENPHLEALPQEQAVFKKILKAFGFSIDATSSETFYQPPPSQIRTATESIKPYILPSELGFLSGVDKIDTDEFAQAPIQVIPEEQKSPQSVVSPAVKPSPEKLGVPEVGRRFELVIDQKIAEAALESDPVKRGQLFEQELTARGIKSSNYTKDLLKSSEFKTLVRSERVDLVQLKVSDLGFTENPTTDQLYAKATELGFELCPSEVALHLRLQESSQPLNTFYRIGMKQIADRRGDPRVFGLERDGDGLWLGYDIALPARKWFLDDQFVFRVRNVSPEF